LRVIQETKYLYRLTRFGMINCFLVQEDDGFTLVDTSVAASSSSILAIAERFDNTIQRVVLTHAHLDHAGSLDALCSQLPGVGVFVSSREARLLDGDFSLDPGEHGKRLFGFVRARSRPSSTLEDGDCIGSLQAIFAPGHTPGHMAYLDVRDGSLLAGDAFTTQMGLVAAGVFKFSFPFPALFSWDPRSSAETTKKLRGLNPVRLAVGHGKTLESPLAEMDRAIELAFRRCSKMLD